LTTKLVICVQLSVQNSQEEENSVRSHTGIQISGTIMSELFCMFSRFCNVLDIRNTPFTFEIMDVLN